MCLGALILLEHLHERVVAVDIEAFRKRCDQMLDRSGLSVMVSTNDGTQAVKIYTSTVEDKIKEVIVLTCLPTETVVVDVVGNLTLKQISRLNF